MIEQSEARTTRISFALGILLPQATQLRSGTCRLFGKTGPPKYCPLHFYQSVSTRLLDAIQGLYWQKGLAATACCISATA